MCNAKEKEKTNYFLKFFYIGICFGKWLYYMIDL